MNTIRGLTFGELVEGLSLEEDVRERLSDRYSAGEGNFDKAVIAIRRGL